MTVYDETMKLFRRQNTNASTPEGPASSEQEDQFRRAWRAMALRLLVSALVVALIALAAAWALSGNRQTTPSHQKAPAKEATSGAKIPQTSKPKASQPSSAGSSSSPPKAAPSGGSLTNTGPGDVAGWFVITSLTATGFYYLVILRRLNAQ